MAWTNEQIKAYREKRMLNGQCEVCGKLCGEDGTKRRCRTCADKLLPLAANRRAKKKAQGRGREIYIRVNGKCVACEKTFPFKEEYEPCLVCIFKIMASMYLKSRRRWQEFEKLWNDQQGICPYTGIKLDLAIDASIDHKMPSSRFPGLKYEITNMEFVHYRVNEMKRDWTKEEFLEFLDMIHLNLKQDEEEPWKESLFI